MADQEILELLQEGADVWNRWRRENLSIDLNLRDADLEEADLAGANLQGADLSGAKLAAADLAQADLSGAILKWAYLQAADLTGARLAGANLSGAVLEGAFLQRADLHEANLHWAILEQARLEMTNLQGAILEDADLEDAILKQAMLERANFHGAILRGATLQYASIGWTVFADVDLRETHALDTVFHRGPSTLGIDTLYTSEGDIPELFLRGCGVPDAMIDYARSLVAAPRAIDYYSVFISYSSKDTALAERLYADLRAAGVRCWYAPHDLTPGDIIIRGIDEAIRLHDKVVLLLSESAVLSSWVTYEVNLASTREALEGRTVLYPLRLDDTVLTTSQGWAVTLREARHIGDFRQWKEYEQYQTAFQRLLRDLTAENKSLLGS